MIINYNIPDPEIVERIQSCYLQLSADLKEKGKVIDNKNVDFGMREFKANGTLFEVNGNPVFLRGTLECCIFPLTGYPPTDIESWREFFGHARIMD